MIRRLNLQRWRKAINSFGRWQGTVAYFLFAWPRLMRSGDRKAMEMQIPTLPYPIRFRPATTDWIIMEQIFIDQAFSLTQWPEHERAIRARYESIIARGLIPVIMDCGAHIGLATLWFAVKFPGARIFAIEPASENFEFCAGTLSLIRTSSRFRPPYGTETQVRLVNTGGEPWAWETRERNSGEMRTVTVP